MDIRVVGRAEGGYVVDSASAKKLGSKSNVVSKAQIDKFRSQGMKKVGFFSGLAGFISGIGATAGPMLAVKIVGLLAGTALAGVAWPVTLGVCGAALLIGVAYMAYKGVKQARAEVKADMPRGGKGVEEKLNETRRSKTAIFGCAALSFGAGFMVGATGAAHAAAAPHLANMVQSTVGHALSQLPPPNPGQMKALETVGIAGGAVIASGALIGGFNRLMDYGAEKYVERLEAEQARMNRA